MFYAVLALLFRYTLWAYEYWHWSTWSEILADLLMLFGAFLVIFMVFL